MGEGLVEAFVEEISTLEGPARMTDFFNAFYKKHGTDKAGLREALEAPTSGTWANALDSRYSDLITITRHHFRPIRAGQPQPQANDAQHGPHSRLPEGLANHVKRWKATVAAFVSSGSKMKKRQNRRAIATAAAGDPTAIATGRNAKAVSPEQRARVAQLEAGLAARVRELHDAPHREVEVARGLGEIALGQYPHRLGRVVVGDRVGDVQQVGVAHVPQLRHPPTEGQGRSGKGREGQRRAQKATEGRPAPSADGSARRWPRCRRRSC